MLQGRTVHAGVLYCTVVFSVAFVLGVLRSVLVAPLAGELTAVALEAPVLLAISWATCGWVVERFEISAQFLDRLVLGGVALVVLLIAEAAVAVLAHGHGLVEFFRSSGRTALLLGLIAQLAFAVFPLLQRRNGA